MRIEKRTLNWFPRQSAYEVVRSQQLKRRLQANDFIERQNAIASTIAGIGNAATSAQGDLAARVAATRLNVKI